MPEVLSVWKDGHIQPLGSAVNISHHTSLEGSVTQHTIMAANSMSLGETAKAIKVSRIASQRIRNQPLCSFQGANNVTELKVSLFKGSVNAICSLLLIFNCLSPLNGVLKALNGVLEAFLFTTIFD